MTGCSACSNNTLGVLVDIQTAPPVIRLSNAERRVLEAMRKHPFMAGKPDSLVILWNGCQAHVYHPEQVN